MSMSHDQAMQLWRKVFPRAWVALPIVGIAGFLYAIEPRQTLPTTEPPRNVASQPNTSAPTVDLGRNMPSSQTATLSLNYRGRLFVIQRDETVGGPSQHGTARYLMEPALFFTPAPQPVETLPKWIHKIDTEADGTLKSKVSVKLKDSNLLDAAAALIVSADDSYLMHAAKERNQGRPLTVVVDTLPLSRFRIELIDLGQPNDVPLAAAEADVSRVAAEADLWFDLSPATLQRITHLHQRDRLGVRPSYSFPNTVLSRARIANFGQTGLRDKLNSFLKNRNLTGNGDVTQNDVSDFLRDVQTEINSDLTGVSAESVALLVNPILSQVTQLFDPVQSVPFLLGTNTADEQKFAEALGALGWVKTSDNTFESVLERSQSNGKSSGASAGVEGQLGDGKKGVGVKLGFANTDEQIAATLQRTSILMQQAATQQGWMASRVEKYKVRDHGVELTSRYTGQVAIGLGEVNGLIPAGVNSIQLFLPEGMATWSRGFQEGLKNIRDTQEAVANGSVASKSAIESVVRLNQSVKGLPTLLATLDRYKTAMTSRDEKGKCFSYLDGKIDGTREALTLLVNRHRAIDGEEAADMAGRGPGHVNHIVAGDDNTRKAFKEELAVLITACETLRTELNDQHKSLVTRSTETGTAIELAANDGLDAQIQSLFPANPSFAQQTRISAISTLLIERAELRKQLFSRLISLNLLLSKLVSDGDNKGIVLRAVQRIDARLGVENRHSYFRGKEVGLSEVKEWYCNTSARLHDKEEAEDLRNWFNGEHLRNAARDIATAAGEVGKHNVATYSAEIEKEFAEVNTLISTIEGESSQMVTIAMRLDKIEDHLESLIQNLLTSVAAN